MRRITIPQSAALTAPFAQGSLYGGGGGIEGSLYGGGGGIEGSLYGGGGGIPMNTQAKPAALVAAGFFWRGIKIMVLPQYKMKNETMENFEMGGIDRSCMASEGQLLSSESLDPELYPHFGGVRNDSNTDVVSGEILGCLDPMEEEITGFCGAVRDDQDGKIYFYWNGQKAMEGSSYIILSDELLDGEKRFARVGQVISILPDKLLVTLSKFGIKTENPETALFVLAQFSFSKETEEEVEGSATELAYTVTLKRTWNGSVARHNVIMSTLEGLIGQKLRLVGYTKSYGEIIAEDQVYYWLLTGVTDTSSNKSNITITLKAYNIFSKNISGKSALEDGGYDTSKNPATISVRKLNPEVCFSAGMGSRFFGLDDTGNMILCTADGDLKQWERYEGISSDSWAAPVATTGAWTGCAVVGNAFLAFKKNALHVVQGSHAMDYQITKNLNTGCMDHHSIAVIDDIVYYLSDVGFCTYYYGQVQEISQPLGRRYVSAMAGKYHGRYHVLATDEEEKKEYLIYDPKLKIWIREGERSFSHLYTLGNGICAISEGGRKILEKGSGRKSWSIQTQRITDRAFVRRGINTVRIIGEFEAAEDYLDVFVTTEQGRQSCGRITAAKKEGVPVRFYATDYYKIEIEGTGGAHLIGIQRQLRGGGSFR